MAFFGWSPLSTLIIIAIALFILLAMINKFGNMFMPFNRWLAWPAGIVPLFIVGLTISAKWGLISGVVLGLVGGIVGGLMFGGTPSDE